MRRCRECLKCQERFTTFKMAELKIYHGSSDEMAEGVVHLMKKSSVRDLLKALEKRPISTGQIEAAIQRIIHKLRASGECEVSSQCGVVS